MTNKKRSKLLAAVLFVAVLVSALPATMLAAGEPGVARSPEVLAQPNENYPSIVPIQKNIVSISYENNHGIAIDEAGSLWGWGANNQGQLGLGATGTNQMFVQTAFSPGPSAALYTQSNYSGAFLEDGSVYWWGTNAYEPTLIDIPGEVVEFHMGAVSALALTSDGKVWSWGRNSHGELGLGHTDRVNEPTQIPTLSGIDSIYLNGYMSFAIKGNNVYSWGYNANNYLLIPGANAAVAHNQTTPTLSSLKNIKSIEINISSTAGSFYAWDNDGQLWRWGYHQWGIGQGVNQMSPVAVSFDEGEIVQATGNEYASYLVLADGSVWAAGQNTYGLLGVGADTGTTYEYVKVEGLPKIERLIVGRSTVYAKTQTGDWWGWGQGYYYNTQNKTYTYYLLPNMQRYETITTPVLIFASSSYNPNPGEPDPDPDPEPGTYTVTLTETWADGAQADVTNRHTVDEDDPLTLNFTTPEGYTARVDCPLPNTVNYSTGTVTINKVTADTTVRVTYTPIPDPGDGDFNVTIIIRYTDGAYEDDVTVYPVAEGSEFFESYTVRPGYKYRKFSLFSMPVYQVNANDQTVYISEVDDDITVQIDYDRITYNVVVTTRYEDGAQDDDVQTYQVNHGEAFDTTFEILDGYEVGIVDTNVRGVSVDGVDKTIEIRSVTGDIYVTITLSKT